MIKISKHISKKNWFILGSIETFSLAFDYIKRLNQNPTVVRLFKKA